MAADRSVAEVFQDVVRNVQEIIRSEVNLAKAELRQEALKTLSSTVWMIGGTITLLFALHFLLWTIVDALALALPHWAAALVVAVVLAVAASVLLMTGVRRMRLVHLTPDRTVESIKENVEWVKQSSK